MLSKVFGVNFGYFLRIALALAAGVAVSACASRGSKLCDAETGGREVRLKSPSNESGVRQAVADYSLTANQTLVVCGDRSKRTWKEIPLSQSERMLKRFLAEAGYYAPKFELDAQTGALVVDPGRQTRVQELRILGAPKAFYEMRFRNIVGEPLNSELLDQVESQVALRLKNLGYPCPSLQTQATEDSGVIQVEVQAGPLVLLAEPESQHSFLYPKAIRRFDAFNLNSEFNFDRLRLSENRAESDGIVANSQFFYRCPLVTPTDSSLALEHHLDAGERRLITLGVGFSTEELLLGQARWKSVRSDFEGSSLRASAYASKRRQRVQGTYEWYPFKNTPRFHFDPGLTLERRFETNFVSTEARADLASVYQWDWQESSLKMSVGPALARSFSEDIRSTQSVTFLNLFGNLTWMTHDFELYQTDPRSGGWVELRSENIYFYQGLRPLASQWKLTGAHLMQLNPVIPHQWVLGVRYGAATTVTSNQSSDARFVPPQFLQALGGDDSLRGFSRNELTLNGVGAKTSLYTGTEVRYAKSLPLGFEPFAFWDLGWLGEKNFQLNSVLYHSPGLGIRWQTPFGVIRGTGARGWVVGSSSDPSALEHAQFFFSYGKEF